MLYLLHGLLFLRWFRVGLEPLTEPKFNRLLRRSAETLQLRRRLTLFCSPIVDSPITIGFRQPTIIIPAKLVNHLSDDEMQSILLHELAHVRQGDALAYLRSGEKFDLVFLDPPYETELLETAIAHIARHDLLNVHGMMIAEHPVDKALPALSAPYRMGRTYRYGKIAVTIYHRDGDEGAQV